MSFQAVGPEELKERSPKLAVQDHDTSSLFASAERNRDPRGRSNGKGMELREY